MDQQQIAQQMADMGWKHLGIGFLFLVCWVVTIIYFYRHIVRQQSEVRELVENGAKALTSATEAIKSMKDSNESLCESMEELSANQTQFLAYLRGRDSIR